MSSESEFTMRPDVVSCDLDGGKALLDLTSSKYYKLNDTAALVWQALEAGATTDGIVERMLEEFEVEEGDCRADVRATLDSFEKAGLIEARPA